MGGGFASMPGEVTLVAGHGGETAAHGSTGHVSTEGIGHLELRHLLAVGSLSVTGWVVAESTEAAETVAVALDLAGGLNAALDLDLATLSLDLTVVLRLESNLDVVG